MRPICHATVNAIHTMNIFHSYSLEILQLKINYIILFQSEPKIFDIFEQKF